MHKNWTNIVLLKIKNKKNEMFPSGLKFYNNVLSKQLFCS